RHRARGTPARVLLPETAVTKPTATQRLSTQGGVSVSGDVLVPLLHRVRLNGSEWRIVVAVLISSRPVSARELALGLRLDYGFVKRIVRGLVAWRILSATPEGLSFQPDATRWAAAPTGRARPASLATRAPISSSSTTSGSSRCARRAPRISTTSSTNGMSAARFS